MHRLFLFAGRFSYTSLWVFYFYCQQYEGGYDAFLKNHPVHAKLINWTFYLSLISLLVSPFFISNWNSKLNTFLKNLLIVILVPAILLMVCVFFIIVV